MAKGAAFEAHWRRYEDWFERHEPAYVSELLALRCLVPLEGHGLEIGVGTGRFAAPLGVAVGVDPSQAMLREAAARGIEVVAGVAEALPFADNSFDFALVVTTICFVDDARLMLAEAHRVLKPGGVLIIGFVDRDSALGQGYLAHQSENVFYRDAVFFSAHEVEQLALAAGFINRGWVQTLFRPLEEITGIEPVRSGYGDGGFVAVKLVSSGAS